MATPSQNPQSYSTQTIELTLPPQCKTTARTQRPWSYWADPHIRTYLEAIQSNTQPSARETAKLWAQILGRALVFPRSSDSQDQNYRLLTRRFFESATQNPLPYEIIDLASPLPPNGKDSIVIQIICHDATTTQASPELQLREIRQRKLALLQQQQLVVADSALLPEFVLGIAVGGHVWFQNLQGEDGCRRGLCKVLCLVQDRTRVEEWLRSLRGTLGVVDESEGSFFDEDSESEDENGCCGNCEVMMV
ncbi:hypothetical protein ASPACDRAFT_57567 [Aspergillus aculeatus ATCC 16872]|uniref:Uncharacterized protein n=1 Tax=Aspergillus aculeatus (strain ATCC 16872 / CBS 172.66 / WB 5094) TaxID=690307 RepID=A0A1L9X704_ASPA1|nr:uncharacterized protein ASPACDRAFT_57567 [Aspergillus aculeatus ATCC 16872]OJK04246.1 hypothetical protein ASPACDRAFT_57567 [Aspergillus aculeatus ATCC 16872]